MIKPVNVNNLLFFHRIDAHTHTSRQIICTNIYFSMSNIFSFLFFKWIILSISFDKKTNVILVLFLFLVKHKWVNLRMRFFESILSLNKVEWLFNSNINRIKYFLFCSRKRTFRFEVNRFSFINNRWWSCIDIMRKRVLNLFTKCESINYPFVKTFDRQPNRSIRSTNLHSWSMFRRLAT